MELGIDLDGTTAGIVRNLPAEFERGDSYSSPTELETEIVYTANDEVYTLRVEQKTDGIRVRFCDNFSGEILYDCTVRDLTSKGWAALVQSAAAAIPELV